MRSKAYFLALTGSIALVIGLLETPIVALGVGDDLTQALVLMAQDEAQYAIAIQQFVENGGGRILHMVPYQAMIVESPVDVLNRVADSPGVAAIFTQPIASTYLSHVDAQVRAICEAWNTLIASQGHVEAPNLGVLADGHLYEQSDAFLALDLPSTTLLSLEDAVTPGYYQTSEYLAGSVAVGIILLESDGTVDSSTEDWTTAESQQVFSEIANAMDWWVAQEPRADLTFVYDDHFSDPLPTRFEPITRPYTDQQYWIADAMAGLGYEDGFYFSRVRDYVNDLRETYQTDWAFTIFVVDSSVDDDNRFSDGLFAYAYLGGPFMVMTYGNNGYGPRNLDAVAAHEVGHIFGALDQYYSARQPCTRRGGYLGVENQNSQYGDCALSVSSIMRGGRVPYLTNALDPYASGQIGWRDRDGDGILDPLDTPISIHIDAVDVVGAQISVDGFAEIEPFPAYSGQSVTINTLDVVQYQVDGGVWLPASAVDGAFDGVTERFRVTFSLSSMEHSVLFTAVDSAGNSSEIYVVEQSDMLDPVNGDAVGAGYTVYIPLIAGAQ